MLISLSITTLIISTTEGEKKLARPLVRSPTSNTQIMASPVVYGQYHSLLLAILLLSTFLQYFVFCISTTGDSTVGDTGTTTTASTDGFSTDDAHPNGVPAPQTISQFVTAHNAARTLVGVPPLVWDSKLANFARAYAHQRRADCDLVHSPGYAYGENIFWGKGRRWAATDVVAAWVSEKQWYHYDSNTCRGPDCTHYTQIVWRTTQKLGCAKIICNSGDTWVACEYYPPGNYIGARPYIVPKH